MRKRQNVGRKRKPQGRRGSALILTMAMMTFILVFFMSFAIMAIYNNRNAKLSDALIQARLHCQTGLEQFYSDMAVALQDPSTAGNRYPATKSGQSNFYAPTTGAWAGRYYWASATNNSDNDGIADATHVTLGGVDFTPSTTLDNGVGWVHIFDPEGSGAIIARVCYLAIDQSGKVDPGAVVDTTIAEGDELRTDSPADISLYPLFTTNAIAQKLQPVEHSGGTMKTGSTWFSFYQIFKENSSAASAPEQVLRGTIFPFSEDIEAFNEYQTGSGGTMVPTAKHRFDLKNADWDSFDNSVDASGIDSPATDYYDEDGNVNPNNGGIPWFYYCEDEDLKKQVIANLIDYCDTDSVATSDYDSNTPDVGPSYVGLERVPYINEIAMTAQLVWDGSQYKIDLIVYPELINIYPNDVGNGGVLTVKLTASGDSIDPDDGDLEVYSFNVPDVTARSVSVLTEVTKSIPLSGSPWDDEALGAVETLLNFSVSIEYAKLVNGDGDIWDYAFTETSTPLVTGSFDVGNVYSISCEVNDPRANLNNDDWTWTAGWTNVASGTPGSTNSTADPHGATKDYEFYATPNSGSGDMTVYPYALSDAGGIVSGISSMHISNDGINTLWELGCIHRGKAWQTLNLSQFFSTATATTGMGTYNEGDANIMDQVKFTEENTSIGKININTPYDNVIKALITNIPIGCTYDKPTQSLIEDTPYKVPESVAEAIAQADDQPVAGELLYHNGSTTAGGEPFHNIGQLALVQKLTDGSCYTPDDSSDYVVQNCDMWKEELVAKIAPYCTTRTNYFTVIITAQVIKDLPDGVLGGTQGTYDAGIDRILAEQKTMAIVQRDAYTNEFKVVRLEYLDD